MKRNARNVPQTAWCAIKMMDAPNVRKAFLSTQEYALSVRLTVRSAPQAPLVRHAKIRPNFFKLINSVVLKNVGRGKR